MLASSPHDFAAAHRLSEPLWKAARVATDASISVTLLFVQNSCGSGFYLEVGEISPSLLVNLAVTELSEDPASWRMVSPAWRVGIAHAQLPSHCHKLNTDRARLNLTIY